MNNSICIKNQVEGITPESPITESAPARSQQPTAPN